MAVEYYDFGPYKIHHSSVFHTTDLSFAFVNLRPAVPGIYAAPFSECFNISIIQIDMYYLFFEIKLVFFLLIWS